MDNITGESGGNPALHDYGNIDIRVKATGVEPAGNPEKGDCGAMDKCCGNCGWWDKDGKDFDACRVGFEGYAICMYALQPGNLKERLGDIVDAHPPCGLKERVTGPAWDEYYAKMEEAKKQIRVHAMDASDYSAIVSSRKDHYCSAWEPEK